MPARTSSTPSSPPERWAKDRRGASARAGALDPLGLPRRRAGGGRLLLASNRLPVTLHREVPLEAGEGGRWRVEAASGGLVTALAPVMKRRGGVWVGWPGAPDLDDEALQRALHGASRRPAHPLRAVPLQADEQQRFYEGYSNEVLWPRFHGLADGLPDGNALREGDWESYRRVNRRFASTLARLVRWDDRIWVHDYHLLLVARELRALGLRQPVDFFLHTPFPPPSELALIPQHRALMEGMLSYDLIGFQTDRDEENFHEAVRRFMGGNREPGSRAGSRKGPLDTVARVRTGVFPISVDFEEFRGGAARVGVRERARELRAELDGRKLILGVDRLDYTKGIPEKLAAFDAALRRFPAVRGRVVLRQLVVPSREGVRAYRDTRQRIESRVREMNQKWGGNGHTPVDYRFGHWARDELLAQYRAADVALVTPLRDGMNLVAKEYCASNRGDGVLILSAFAGASMELRKSALLVNPSEPEAVAGAIHAALSMDVEERRSRMASANAHLRSRDVHHWVRSFIGAELGGAMAAWPDPSRLLPRMRL